MQVDGISLAEVKLIIGEQQIAIAQYQKTVVRLEQELAQRDETIKKLTEEKGTIRTQLKEVPKPGEAPRPGKTAKGKKGKPAAAESAPAQPSGDTAPGA